MVECRVGSNFLYLSWGKLMDAMEATNWHRWGGSRIHLKINEKLSIFINLILSDE
jgi:hypothetical protein